MFKAEYYGADLTPIMFFFNFNVFLKQILINDLFYFYFLTVGFEKKFLSEIKKVDHCNTSNNFLKNFLMVKINCW